MVTVYCVGSVSSSEWTVGVQRHTTGCGDGGGVCGSADRDWSTAEWMAGGPQGATAEKSTTNG